MSAKIFCRPKFRIYPVPSKHIKITSNSALLSTLLKLQCPPCKNSPANPGNLWQSPAISGNFWQSLVISGNLWQSPAISSNLRQSLAISGNLLKSVAISGNVWQMLTIDCLRFARDCLYFHCGIDLPEKPGTYQRLSAFAGVQWTYLKTHLKLFKTHLKFKNIKTPYFAKLKKI